MYFSLSKIKAEQHHCNHGMDYITKEETPNMQPVSKTKICLLKDSY